jgi:anthranilate phosphoribosyltransferase
VDIRFEKVLNGGKLSQPEAAQLMSAVADGQVNSLQVSALAGIFRSRGVCVDELIGFREELLQRAVAVDLREFAPVDLCGTGGDQKGTFNISTATSFVVAGAGIAVAKHGNYGWSSKSGSSNVLEALGIALRAEPEFHRRALEKAGLTFLHAPLFHTSLKSVAEVRRGLGVRTFFNLLGPLLNPARPRRQVIGVSDLQTARLYQNILGALEIEFVIAHSMDGYDELSLTGPMLAIDRRGRRKLVSSDFGMTPVVSEALLGGESAEQSAEIIRRVLDNSATKQQTDVVIANAALAISLSKPELDLQQAVLAARESLQSGRAQSRFHQLRLLS